MRHALFYQVRVQHHPEGGDADSNQSSVGVPVTAAGAGAHHVPICRPSSSGDFFFFSLCVTDKTGADVTSYFPLFDFLLLVIEEMGSSI